MAIALIGFGVALLLAAIMGGGVEFSQLKIPQTASGGKRFAIGILGALLLCFGFYSGGANDPPDEPPESTRTPPPVAVATLVGTVTLTYHAAEFIERHADYSITASAGPTQEFSADIDAQGKFLIDGVPEVPPYTVSWGVSRPSEFVIWPLTHPSTPPGEELGGFRFQLLSDVFGNEKRRMLEAVTSGNLGEADARLSTILQLFERLGIRDAPTDPIARDIRRRRFTVHQELARAAHDFRIEQGRSRITDQQVQTERGWRRTMINTALEQPASGQRIRDFVRAANSWAAYARQVFSRAQRSWPNRSLASRQTPGGEEFLEDGSYATPLLEDIALIKEKLVTPQIQALVDENANRQGQMTRLSDGQRLAVESFSVLLEQDPDSVPLNQFVNLLSALHRLAVSGD